MNSDLGFFVLDEKCHDHMIHYFLHRCVKNFDSPALPQQALCQNRVSSGPTLFYAGSCMACPLAPA